ncbi:uncharacterized protein BDR25DRAFT_353923 [Lindgomyces ingoldianus]|uniref:Uncharacterized protein n=1 Tax=Lindgomyces ingoldianus TaxID=673940 RepID=A0ACB6R195_9PLEO|nr:uncharacterized protein BDR25DRAFT_353923 [Lindgomyces ingoldianus]KAF2472221.1 hypothetical protein BDR25DRAFT_353923 [Lindgomyces ingoldianus]
MFWLAGQAGLLTPLNKLALVRRTAAAADPPNITKIVTFITEGLRLLSPNDCQAAAAICMKKLTKRGPYRPRFDISEDMLTTAVQQGLVTRSINNPYSAKITANTKAKEGVEYYENTSIRAIEEQDTQTTVIESELDDISNDGEVDIETESYSSKPVQSTGFFIRIITHVTGRARVNAKQSNSGGEDTRLLHAKTNSRSGENVMTTSVYVQSGSGWYCAENPVGGFFGAQSDSQRLCLNAANAGCAQRVVDLVVETSASSAAELPWTEMPCAFALSSIKKIGQETGSTLGTRLEYKYMNKE